MHLFDAISTVINKLATFFRVLFFPYRKNLITLKAFGFKHLNHNMRVQNKNSNQYLRLAAEKGF